MRGVIPAFMPGTSRNQENVFPADGFPGWPEPQVGRALFLLGCSNISLLE